MTRFFKTATSRHIIINGLTIVEMVDKLAEFAESSKHAAWRYNLSALSGRIAWQVTVQRSMRLN